MPTSNLSGQNAQRKNNVAPSSVVCRSRAHQAEGLRKEKVCWQVAQVLPEDFPLPLAPVADWFRVIASAIVAPKEMEPPLAAPLIVHVTAQLDAALR
mmetsp:Transcript_48744/g.97254  ORF Transcript_48744/g.97254 Transcript_48744/m.97254 type:complete len:97 (-) Transcript_48744:346-636(-)